MLGKIIPDLQQNFFLLLTNLKLQHKGAEEICPLFCRKFMSKF